MTTLISNEDLDIIYPIGSLYYSSDNINPTCIVGGIWDHFNGCRYCFIRVG